MSWFHVKSYGRDIARNVIDEICIRGGASISDPADEAGKSQYRRGIFKRALLRIVAIGDVVPTKFSAMSKACATQASFTV
jgi:hypothetical protein